MTPCAHCHEYTVTSLYRLFGVGPRRMCSDCATKLRAIGLDIEPERRAVPRWRERDLSRDLTEVGR